MKSKKYFFLLLFFILILTAIIQAEGLFTYTVKKGDSLSIIANSFNIDVKELIKTNNINDPDLIYIGQNLKIPETEKKVYQVKKGDSLWQIAQLFKVKTKDLIKINNLKNPDKLYVDQKIIIPVTNSRVRYTLASRELKINYIWPVVKGSISSNYGWRNHPIYKRKEFHTGLDIAVPYGTPVYAAADGVVIFSGKKGGYGNLIIIQHRDKSLTYYGHNLELLVKKGDSVRQGKVISFSGNSGTSTGPHLHFEIRVNDKHTNPLQYLNKSYMNNGFRI